MNDLPHMDYAQYRRMRKLVRDCCSYQDGNCILLDDGEECVCPQRISRSLICYLQVVSGGGAAVG